MSVCILTNFSVLPLYRTLYLCLPPHKCLLLCFNTDPGFSINTGIVGQNITFYFTFSRNITKNSKIAIYKSEEKKISDYSQLNRHFEVDTEHSSLLYHKTHLTLNDTDDYYAALFVENEPPLLSNKVQLVVREDNRSSTGKDTI